jgi:hypothetical protein
MQALKGHVLKSVHEEAPLPHPMIHWLQAVRKQKWKNRYFEKNEQMVAAKGG